MGAAGDCVEAAIARGIAASGAECAQDLPTRLAAYVAMLARWNRVYNLTAVRDPAAMVTRHILDALSVLPHLHASRMLDVGTGAGIPGLVIALARPEMRCVLLDSNGKKTRFCVQTVAELGLDNVEVVQSRVEEYAPQSLFPCIVARGFGSVGELVGLSAPLLAPGGRLVLMKGIFPGAELEELGAMRENARVVELNVPGLGAARHLVLMDKGEEK